MKILYIITRGDSIGGTQIHVRDFSLRLKAEGHEPVVVVGTPGLLTEQLTRAGLRFIHLPELVRPIHPVKDLIAVRKLRRILRAEQPAIVSSHASKAGTVARLAARGLPLASVFTAHGWAFTDGVSPVKARLYAAVERCMSRFCDAIITVSQNDFDLAVEHGVASAPKMVRIHNGMPPRPAPERRAYGDPPRLIMVARFQRQKDHDTLFAALAELKDLTWRIDLVGDGPLLETYRARAAALGIVERTAFLGQRDDVPELLDRSDIFLLVSRWEGFPRSTIEAMRAALPVLISDVGGSAEAVIPGKTGYLIPREDSRVLADLIRGLLKDPARGAALGRAGRSRYEAEFSFDAMYARTWDVYTRVLEA